VALVCSGLKRIDSVAELPGGGKSVGRYLRERTFNHFLEFDRHGRADNAYGLRSLAHVSCNDRLPGGPAEWRFSHQHLEQRAPERVDVGTTGKLDFPGPLLGTHVGRRPHGNAGIRDLLAAGRTDRPGEPEIRHYGVTTAQQHIRGLDVPVHHTVAVRESKRIGHFPDNPQGIVEWELLFSIQPIPQRLPFDIRHDIVEEPVRLAGVEQRQDVRVIEPSGDSDLTKETLGT
jgi:hypothetical protein